MLCLAIQSYTHYNDAPPEYQGKLDILGETYRVRTAECINIADISKPTEFMIEALLYHSYAEYNEQTEGDKGGWLMSATIMRLALQQGYHRDPSKHQNLSIFQGEIRRRIWLSVCHHELMFAVQIGLPKAVRYAECDTQMPANLADDELWEDMEELPPSRPLTEMTECTYHLAKSYIMEAYGHIIEHLQAVTPQSYEEVMRLDAMIMEAQAMVPPQLQLRPLKDMLHDEQHLVLERIMIQQLYNKALCVLHRKYWNFSPVDESEPIYFYSRRACMTAAVNLLDIQAVLHEASLPGGPIKGMKWYHFSNTNHDFLLAAMLLCLDLKSCYDCWVASEKPLEMLCNGLEVSAMEKLKAVQRSIDIWAEVTPYSNEAAKVVGILTTIVRKILLRDGASLDDDSPESCGSGYPISADTDAADSPARQSWDKFGLGIPLLSTLPTGNNTLQDNIFDSGGVLSPFAEGSTQRDRSDLDWVSILHF